MGFLDEIKKFDAYPKTLEDFRIKTLGGGTITVVSGVVMLLLFASEIQDYLTPSVDEQLFVDTTRGSKLKINLDIVFPKTVNYDFAVNFYDLAAKFSRLIFNEIAVIF